MTNDRRIFYVSSLDAKSFLHRILTNDINNINDKLQYNLLLTPQGKLLHDMFIFKVSENCYMIDCHQNGYDNILEIFNKYRLSDQVFFHEMHDMHQKLQFSDPRNCNFKSRFYFNNTFLNDEYDIEYNKKVHYNLSLPRLYIDFQPNEYFPFEVNFDKFNAISYTKGCYIGQEIITRTKHRGAVNKQSYSVILSSKSDECLNIYDNNNCKVGKILKIYSDTTAIAMVRNDSTKNTLRLQNDVVVTCQIA